MKKQILDGFWTIIESAKSKSGELSAFLAQPEQYKEWLSELTQSTATHFDKALDETYLREHIGGGNHRLFDGGHDLFNAWGRAKSAAGDDAFSQEVLGYASALWKDLTTVKGLPFATLEKANYDEWADKICGIVPGLSKDYLYDLLSFDALEVFSAALGTVSVIFVLSQDDRRKLSEILAAMGVSAIISANPIMGVITIALTAYAYFVKKRSFDKTAAVKSGTVAAVSAGLFAIMGMPILVELTVVLVLSNLLRKQVLDNESLQKLLIKNAKEVLSWGSSVARRAA